MYEVVALRSLVAVLVWIKTIRGSKKKTFPEIILLLWHTFHSAVSFRCLLCRSYSRTHHLFFPLKADFFSFLTTHMFRPWPAGSSLVEGAWYEIAPRHSSGKRVDVYYAHDTEGTAIHLWTANGTAAQFWRAQRAGRSSWIFEPRCAPGMALTANQNQQCTLMRNRGTPSQKWTLRPATDGYSFMWVEDQSSGLDVSGASTSDGAQILAWGDRHCGVNQQFMFTREGAEPSTDVASSSSTGRAYIG
jgi:hypothetical protein